MTTPPRETATPLTAAARGETLGLRTVAGDLTVMILNSPDARLDPPTFDLRRLRVAGHEGDKRKAKRERGTMPKKRYR